MEAQMLKDKVAIITGASYGQQDGTACEGTGAAGMQRGLPVIGAGNMRR